MRINIFICFALLELKKTPLKSMQQIYFHIWKTNHPFSNSAINTVYFLKINLRGCAAGHLVHWINRCKQFLKWLSKNWLKLLSKEKSNKNQSMYLLRHKYTSCQLVVSKTHFRNMVSYFETNYKFNG